MDGIESWVGIVSGVLAIIGVVVAVTRHLTKVQEQGERDAILATNRKLTDAVAALEGRQAQLLDQIAVSDRAGAAALAQKAELDNQLLALMQATGATGGSIYVPVRAPSGAIHGLAFLSMEPFTPQTQALKARIIPLKSLAGKCFTTGSSFLVRNAATSPEHYKAAGQVASYAPGTILNIALRHDGETVGVLQLLTRAGEQGFAEVDVQRMERRMDRIPAAVAEIARTPDFLRVLGLADEALPTTGTALFFDLSKSSLLFQDLSSAFALQLLNDYFEQMCECAFRLGGTLDNYMGDGALLRFNVPRPLVDHELAAVTAGLDMCRAFTQLRAQWTEISPRLADTHHRVGISTGPLLRATLGHSQIQRLTVIGYPVSVAAGLCDQADRDRNIILISDETMRSIKDRVIATPLKQAALGKAGQFTDAAFEVTGLR